VEDRFSAEVLAEVRLAFVALDNGAGAVSPLLLRRVITVGTHSGASVEASAGLLQAVSPARTSGPLFASAPSPGEPDGGILEATTTVHEDSIRFSEFLRRLAVQPALAVQFVAAALRALPQLTTLRWRRGGGARVPDTEADDVPKPFACLICLDNCPGIERLRLSGGRCCDHMLCRSCVRAWLTVHTSEGTVNLRCPLASTAGGCEAVVGETDFLAAGCAPQVSS
jgi:hypothetical protein